MKEWRRVPADTLCGLCGATIHADLPAQFTRLRGVKRERVRCSMCVGTPAPDLPERVAPYNSITPTKKSKPSRMSAFHVPADYTTRMLGERE